MATLLRRGSGGAPITNRRPRFRGGWTLVILAVAVLAVAGFGSGWWAAGNVASTRAVRIDRFFSGRVIDVSSDGSAVCVNPDSGGTKLCGLPYQQGGARRLSVGDHVGIAVEDVKTGRPGESIQIYVIYSPPPSQ